jgi:hypothetical protein
VCGLGSYFNALVDFRFGRIVRIRPDATVAFNKDCTAYYSGNAAPGGITQVAAAPDGAGGAYGTWHDFDSATPTHGDFGQHFNSSGTALWTAPYAVPFSGRVVQDGSVGVWWVGRPPGVPGIEVHRRLASGALPTGWTSAGVTITESTSLHTYSTAALPTALALCWSENGTGGDKDLRALSVNQEGVIPPGWESGGTPVCTAVGDQIGPFLLPDGAEGALACWVDQRAGASAPDIYATRIEPPPLVGVRPTAAHGFGFVAAGPNPARDRIELTFELSGDEPATLEVLDLAGRSLRRVALAGGTGPRTASLGLGDLANGVYFLRITQGTRAATTRVAIAR